MFAILCQALTTASVSVIGWLLLGCGLFRAKGNAAFGNSQVGFSAFERVGLDEVMFGAALTCIVTAAIGASVPYKVRTRAFLVLAFVTAAIGVPIAARAVWSPEGVLQSLGLSARPCTQSESTPHICHGPEKHCLI